MKRKQWLAGILAAGLLCALPLFGAFAAPRARTRAVAPLTTGATSMALTAQAGPSYTYGDTITFKATYTPATGESVPSAGAQVVFLCGTTELGQAKLEKNASTSNYEATLTYATTSKKGIVVGKNSITAQYTPSVGSPAVISNEVNISLLAKALTAAPKNAVSYNGTTTFKDIELDLSGVVDADAVSAKADLTVSSKNVGNQQITTATATGTAKNGLAKEAAAPVIALSGDPAGFYTLPASAVTGTLEIQKAKLSFTAGAEDKAYDGGKTVTAKDVQFVGLQNSEALEKDTDYTVSAEFTGDDYNAANSAKTVQVTVSLFVSDKAKNYSLQTNTFNTTAKINPAQLAVASATVVQKTYDGTKAATVTGVQFSGLVGGDSLAPDTGYTVIAEFKDANAGTGKEVQVTVAAGTNPLTNYALPAGAFFTTGTIDPKLLKNDMVALPATNYTYDGAKKEPVPTVADGSLLVPGDYELVYENNINAGTDTAKVTVKARDGGNYTGSVEKTFSIAKYKLPPLTVTLQRKSESGKAPVLQMKVTAGPRPSTGAAWPTGSVDIKVQAGSDTRQGAGVFTDGALTLELSDIAGASLATATASYVGDANYEPAAGSGPFNLAPAPTPAPTPKPAPTPAPTPKPFDWYPGLGSIQSVKSGKVTIDAGSEIAVPHFIWQAIYGKDITLTITRGADKYVFNGLDLKASGFDPDNGHNLTDLKAYIGRSYDKPKAPATPAPTASPKPTASPSPAPAASPAPTTAPQETPAPSAQPAQGGAASGWLYWVIGGAALLIVVLGAVLLFLRRKNAEQDPYGYND